VRRLLPLALAALAIAAAALTANLFVLDRAGRAGDPVGTLSPVQPTLTGRAQAPPAEHRHERDEEDDD